MKLKTTYFFFVQIISEIQNHTSRLIKISCDLMEKQLNPSNFFHKISVSCVHPGLTIITMSTLGTTETNSNLTIQLLIFNQKIWGWGVFFCLFFVVCWLCGFFSLGLSFSFNSCKSYCILFYFKPHFTSLFTRSKSISLISVVVVCPVDMQYVHLCSCLPPLSLLSKWHPRD